MQLRLSHKRLVPSLAIIVCAAGAIGCADNDYTLIYAVQVAAVGEDQVLSATRALSRENWGPIYTTQTVSSPLVKISVGRFDSAAEAEWWKQSLRRKGYPDAFKTSFTQSRLNPIVHNTGPVDRVFRKLERTCTSSSVDLLLEDVAGRQIAPVERFNLNKILSDAPESNTATETEALHLVSALQPFADGSSSVQAACRARIAVAHVWHYSYARKWLLAFQCYGEALELAAPGSLEEADCLIQRAALLMELCQSQQGDNMATCRRFCDVALNRISSQFTRHRCIVALIHAESHFFEQSYDTALDELLTLQESWPNRLRECVMASVFAGICCHRLGMPEQAEALLRDTLRMNPQPADFFQWHGTPRDLCVDAGQWLAMLSQKKGRTDQAVRWRQFVQERRNDVTKSPQTVLEENR